VTVGEEIITERKPPGMSQESWVELQIRRAIEEGRFDNLPGAGKPLRNLHRASDPMWWAREKARAEGLDTTAMLPPALRLRKERQRLLDTVAELPTERAVREAVEDLNTQIREHWRGPSFGPSIPVALLDADETLERWRAARRARESAAPDLAPRSEAEPPPGGANPNPRRGWWRRLLGRRT
jgi:Domain of unknown function (DUF1992).